MATETLPRRFKALVDEYSSVPVQYFKDENGDFQSITYGQMYSLVEQTAGGLLDIGVERGDHLGLISDNRAEWLHLDLAILSIGAVDIPRGNDSTTEEIQYILHHGDCRYFVAENIKQLHRILPDKDAVGEYPELKGIILFEGEDPGGHGDLPVYTFSEIKQRGAKYLEQAPQAFESEIEKGDGDDLATIIYTSGTTGKPKGVMLTHISFLFQLDRVKGVLYLGPADIFLSVLPIWHSFERAVEYVVLNNGASIAYSKPIGRIMLDDMQAIRPTWMTSVPRIWEGIRSAVYRNINKDGGIKKTLFYFFVNIGELHAGFFNILFGRQAQFTVRNRVIDIVLSVLPFAVLTPLKLLGNALVFRKIKAKIGGRFKVGVSGGGALPAYVDRFFQAAGILLLEGYGLTETAPILSVREQLNPVYGTVGPLLRDVEYRLLDSEGNSVSPGEKGVLYVRSPQVMKGYYKMPEETKKVLSEDGWLNTGDLAVFTHTGEFTIIGRVKETIVLLGGENIEPAPIEEMITQSSYIDQVMVVGQDKKYLGALVVPNMELLEEYAVEQHISYIEAEELLEHEEIQELIREEILALVNQKTGFKLYEQVFRTTLLARPFEVGKELTPSLKLRRNVIADIYKQEIESLYH